MPKFRTVRFGDLDYDRKDLIYLAEGLVGMPNLKNWLILEMGDNVPMKWFQSLDRGDFGFPITQPYLFHDDYEVSVQSGTLEQLGTVKDEDLAVLIITTVHPGGTKVTGNLLAPLVIDTETRKGAQLALDNADYGMRQEINYFKFGLAVQSESAENSNEATAGQAAGQEPECRETADQVAESKSQESTRQETESPEPAGV